MNLLRRRLMMQETVKTSNAKYPLVNGRHEFQNDSFVEITNGNHVLFRAPNKAANAFINLSNILQNLNDAASVGNINFLPAIYTIPAGVPTKFEIKNVTGNGNFACETNFRLAGELVSGSFHTGKFTYVNPEHNTSLDVVLEAEEEVGCLFLYYSGGTNIQMEFDIEFAVNGERWI